MTGGGTPGLPGGGGDPDPEDLGTEPSALGELWRGGESPLGVPPPAETPGGGAAGGQGQDVAEARNGAAHGIGKVWMPGNRAGSPLLQVGRRLSLALLVLVVTAMVVWADHSGYHDANDPTNRVSLLDSFYYATVTLSTTGYGDITPATPGARLVNILVITPLRVLFLIILVGTTLEVLTERTRTQWRVTRWRSSVRDHTVIVGFGTKGRTAASTLISQGQPKDRIVVVDAEPRMVEAANAHGLVGVLGDATRSEVLRRAETDRARQVIIAGRRDDTAVLVTLTARQLNRTASIVVAVREEENVPLIRQSGASAVVTSSSAAGRLLGMSTLSPRVGAVLEDLLSYGSGLDVGERPVAEDEVGRAPRECRELVVSVIRGHRVMPYDDPDAGTLQATDRVITVRHAAD